MADYPRQYIDKADAVATKEGTSLIGLYLLDMVATIAGLYVIGLIMDSIL